MTFADIGLISHATAAVAFFSLLLLAAMSWQRGAVGAWWTFSGTFVNSAVMARVTVLTEQRMQRGERKEAWLAYKRRTSVWIPWPPRQR